MTTNDIYKIHSVRQYDDDRFGMRADVVLVNANNPAGVAIEFRFLNAVSLMAQTAEEPDLLKIGTDVQVHLELRRP